jgi:hypothetical protein
MLWKPWASSLALCLALSSVANAAETVITPEARGHFQAGVAFVEDPDGARFEEAYREFKIAYSLSPAWKILGNLGLVALKLERDGEAIAAYTKYLEEGGDQLDAEERAQVTRDLQMLKSGLVEVTVTSNPPGITLRDERFPDAGPSVINRYVLAAGEQKLGLHPGRHRIVAHLDGYEDQIWNLDAQASVPVTYTFDLKKIEQPATPVSVVPPTSADQAPRARPVPISVFILAGAGVALAGGGLATGLMAKSKRDDYDSANGKFTSTAARESAQDLKDDGERLNLIADVLFAGAIVSSGVAVVLFATRPEVQQQQGSLRLTPLLGPRGGGATLVGSF